MGQPWELLSQYVRFRKTGARWGWGEVVSTQTLCNYSLIIIEKRNHLWINLVICMAFFFSWFPRKISLKNVNLGLVELKRKEFVYAYAIVISKLFLESRRGAVRDHSTWEIRRIQRPCSSLPTWGFPFKLFLFVRWKNWVLHFILNFIFSPWVMKVIYGHIYFYV